FARDFLASDTYRANVKRRIMGGKAPHMEVLLHHYAFGKPKFQVGDAEVTSPQSQEISRRAEVLGHLTKEERREYFDILNRARAIWDLAEARRDTASATAGAATGTEPSTLLQPACNEGKVWRPGVCVWFPG